MDLLKQVPMGAKAIIVGTISAIAWIALEGTLLLIISILAGATIALRATLDDES